MSTIHRGDTNTTLSGNNCFQSTSDRPHPSTLLLNAIVSRATMLAEHDMPWSFISVCFFIITFRTANFQGKKSTISNYCLGIRKLRKLAEQSQPCTLSLLTDGLLKHDHTADPCLWVAGVQRVLLVSLVTGIVNISEVSFLYITKAWYKLQSAF